MFASSYGIAIGIAVFCAAVAAYLQRRLPDRTYSYGLVCVAWAILSVLSLRLVTGHAAPYFWSADAASSEPWERLAFPLAVVSILWMTLQKLTVRSPRLASWLAVTLACLPLVAALPNGESYSDIVPGNAVWSLAAVIAVGANWLASESLVSSGAGRWSLWVFVAQLLTVAGLLMTCYATLAEWCLVLGLVLTVFAALNFFAISDDWARGLMLPATILSCSLLTHIRIYSIESSSSWMIALTMLSPVIVVSLDRMIARKRHPNVRVAIAAVVAALLATTVLVSAVGMSKPDW